MGGTGGEECGRAAKLEKPSSQEPITGSCRTSRVGGYNFEKWLKVGSTFFCDGKGRGGTIFTCCVFIPKATFNLKQELLFQLSDNTQTTPNKNT